MPLARNTGSTLGGICTNLLIYDPNATGGAKIVDLGSAPSTFTTHANVTFGSATWDGATRNYFQTAQSGGTYQGVDFTASHPVLKFGSGEGGNGFFVAGSKGSGTTSDTNLIVCPNSSFVAGLAYDKASAVYRMAGRNGSSWGNSGIADSPEDFTTNKAIVVNCKFNVANGKQMLVDADTGTKTAFDLDTTELGDMDVNGKIESLGGSAGNTTYCIYRFYVLAVFSRMLTISESQTLRDDWFAQLINAADVTTSIGGSALTPAAGSLGNNRFIGL